MKMWTTACLSISFLSLVLLAGCKGSNEAEAKAEIEVHTTKGGWRYEYIHIPDASGYKVVIGAPSDFHYKEKNLLISQMGVELLQISGYGDVLPADKMAAFESLNSNAALSDASDAVLAFAYLEEKELDKVIPMFAGSINDPKLDPDGLAKIKENYVNGIEGHASKSFVQALNILSQEMLGESALLFGSFRTTVENAGAVDMASIEQWLKALYGIGGIKIGVAGMKDPSKIEPFIDQILEQFLPESPVVNIPDWQVNFSGRTLVLQRDDIEKSNLVFEAPWPQYEKSLDESIALFAAMALGGGDQSRLSIKVRDELRASYGMSAAIEAIDRTHNGLFISGEVAVEYQTEVLDMISSIVNDIKSNGITEDEFNRIKEGFLVNIENMTRDENSVAYLLAMRQLSRYSSDDILSEIEEIKALTFKEVNVAIKANFPEFSQFIKVIVTPETEGLNADCILKSVDDFTQCKQ